MVGDTAAAIEKLIGYSATDWVVTDSDEKRVVALMAADPNLGATVLRLDGAGKLGAVIERVDGASNRQMLIQLLAGRLENPVLDRVAPHVYRCGADWRLVFEICRELQAAMRRHVPGGGRTPFNPSAFAGLVATTPSAPFTGAGATGDAPWQGRVPLGHQALLLVKHQPTRAEYTNPIPGFLPDYLNAVGPRQRVQQGILVLRRPIVTLSPMSYRGPLPSRADVIRGAGRAHNLQPQLLAALLLAEQRDQSRNEDAKDFAAAMSAVKADTSVGLGQVKISTAKRHDLFADLLSPGTRMALSHRQAAALLASDEFNIFAVARYARWVANQGGARHIATLPKTKMVYPGIQMFRYSQDSSTWPDDNIRALGSEFTSRPWDDDIFDAWGEFVFEAFRDIRSAGVF